MSNQELKRKKYSGFSKMYAGAKARDLLDCDYLDSLAGADAKWMEKYLAEYYQCRVLKTDSSRIHNTDSLLKSIYDANNARRRDIWTKFTRTLGEPFEGEDAE